MIVSIRPRTRLPVSGLAVYNGVKMSSTASVLIRPIGRSPRLGQT
jgi:hypothetical protein